MDVLRNLFDIRADEWPRFGLLFAAFFIFSVGAALADSSTRAVLGDQVDSAQVYYGITTIFISIFYTAFVDRIPKHLLLLVMTLISGVLVAGGLLVVLLGSRVAGSMILYVLSEVILLIWVLQWKTNLLDFYDTRTAKRILPLLGVSRLLGLSAGSFAFPILTNTFANMGISQTTEAIYIIWTATYGIVFVILFLMPRLLRDPKPEWPQVESGYLDGIREGFVYIAQSRYLKWMAVSAVLMNGVIALFVIVSTELVTDYYLVEAVTGGSPIGINRSLDGLTITPEAQAQAEQAAGTFFATVRGYASLLMLLVQLFIFPRILKRFGLGNVNLLYPTSTMGIAIWVSLVTLNPAITAFTLAAAGATMVSVKSYRRVFRTPVNGLLVNAVPSFMKGRARSVINGIISPFANITIGLLLTIESFTLLGQEITSVTIFVTVALIVSVAYLLSCWVLRREYGRAMIMMLEAEDYSALLDRDYEIDAVDEGALRRLQTRLDETDDPAVKQFIATLMLQAGDEAALPLIIASLQRADDAGKRGLLQALIESGLRGSQLRQALVMYVQSDVDALRRVALIGLMQVTDPAEDVRQQIAADNLHDPDPRVRSKMVAALLDTTDGRLLQRANRVLGAMLTDTDVVARLQAVNVLAERDDPAEIRRLLRSLDDHSDDVRLAATLAIEKLWRDDLPQDIQQLVLARQQLLMDDPVERVRLAELAILGKIRDEKAADALVRALADASPSVRQAAREALVQMPQRAQPALKAARTSGDTLLARQSVFALLMLEPGKYRDEARAALHDMLDDIFANHGRLQTLSICEAHPTLNVLRTHFQETNARLLDDIFTVIALLSDDASVRTVRDTLASSNKRTRSNAVEALESLATPELARRIGMLYEPDASHEALQAQHREGFTITLSAVFRELLTGSDRWLQAVAMMALGEIMATNEAVRAGLANRDIPTLAADEQTPCQQQIPLDFAVVTVRSGLSSSNTDVRLAARAAVRLIQGRSVLDKPSEQEEVQEEAMLSIIERMIYLKRVSLFQSLSVDQLRALANISDEALFKKGERLFNAGDEGGVLYVVVSGMVNVGLGGAGESLFTRLATYGPNDAFGEMSLFDGLTRSADAIAAEDTLTLTLRREPFLALAQRYPDLSLYLITELSGRLRQANEQIASMNDA